MTAPPPSRAQALAGQYTLHPGCTPAITGNRPVLAPGALRRLLQGQDRAQLLRSLGGLFTLCAQAHQWCAEQAFRLACGQDPAVARPQQLAWLTARDHLRSMALDWPARLAPGQAPDLAWLRTCPLALGAAPPADASAAQAQLSALGHWLQTELVHEPLPRWLDRCTSDQDLLQWCRERPASTTPAQCLLRAQPLLELPALALRTLPGGDADVISQLAHALWQQDRFCEHPTWQDACAENGPWTRWRHPQRETLSPFARLASRLRELVELGQSAESDAPALLAQGALVLEPGCAVAWCEMARGLLLHSVRLDGQACVQDYRVLAPTEWNFHPQGSLGQAVARLARDDGGTARLLAAAFDPCVACQ